MSAPIFIVRPEPKATESAEFFRRAGRDACATPATRLEALPVGDYPSIPATGEKELAVGEIHAIIFTSANAVKFLLRRVEEPAPDFNAFKLVEAVHTGRAPLIVIGDKTASVCRSVFNVEPMLIARVSSQAELADELADSPLAQAGDCLLMPCARQAAGDLRDRMAEINIPVIMAPIYDSTPDDAGPEELRKYLSEQRPGANPWVIFYAPSQVKAVAASPGGKRGKPLGDHFRLAAIGPTTGEAITEAFGRPPDAVALRPNDKGILDAIQALEATDA